MSRARQNDSETDGDGKQSCSVVGNVTECSQIMCNIFTLDAYVVFVFVVIVVAATVVVAVGKSLCAKDQLPCDTIIINHMSLNPFPPINGQM